MGRVSMYVFDLKLCYESWKVHYLASRRFGHPPQQSNSVRDCLWLVLILHIVLDRSAFVPLGEFFTIQCGDSGEMNKNWFRLPEQFIENNVLRSARDPLLPSEYVGYSHFDIVYYICEVVGWKPVAFKYNKVFDRFLVKLQLAIYCVPEMNLPPNGL